MLLQNSEGKHLLLRRASESKINPSRWEPPGGKIDPGERLDDALQREAFEEAGLLVVVDQLLGAVQFELSTINVACLIMGGRVVSGDVRLSSEHDAFRWFSQEEIRQIDLATHFRRYFFSSKEQRHIMVK